MSHTRIAAAGCMRVYFLTTLKSADESRYDPRCTGQQQELREAYIVQGEVRGRSGPGNESREEENLSCATRAEGSIRSIKGHETVTGRARCLQHQGSAW